MLRPVSMSSQDSVQELLGNRLAPSLLRGNPSCVNQCLPFILHKPSTISYKQKAVIPPLQTFVDETKLTSNLKTSSEALFLSPWD
jgi:hypothetical protein